MVCIWMEIPPKERKNVAITAFLTLEIDNKLNSFKPLVISIKPLKITLEKGFKLRYLLIIDVVMEKKIIIPKTLINNLVVLIKDVFNRVIKDKGLISLILLSFFHK